MLIPANLFNLLHLGRINLFMTVVGNELNAFGKRLNQIIV